MTGTEANGHAGKTPGKPLNQVRSSNRDLSGVNNACIQHEFPCSFLQLGPILLQCLSSDKMNKQPLIIPPLPLQLFCNLPTTIFEVMSKLAVEHNR